MTGPVDFDPGIGTTSLTADGDGDTYIAVYNSSLALQWVRMYSSGPSYPTFNDVLLTNTGDVYTSIRCSCVYDFDPTAGVQTLTSYGYDDGFLVRLDALGAYQWTAQFSAAGTDGEMGKIYDNGDGTVTLATSQKGTIDIDPSAGSRTAAFHGQSDNFYTVINADKSWGGLGGSIGGAAYDYVNALSRDSAGNFMLAGLMMSTNFDVNPNEGVTQLLTKPSTGWDLYAAKFSSTGAVLWSYAWGAAGDQFIWRTSESVQDYLFMRGTYTSGFDVNFDPLNIVTLANAGSHDGFLTIVNASGQHVRTFNISSTDGGDNILGFKKDGRDLWIYGYAGSAADLTSFGYEDTFTGGFIMPVYNVFP